MILERFCINSKLSTEGVGISKSKSLWNSTRLRKQNFWQGLRPNQYFKSVQGRFLPKEMKTSFNTKRESFPVRVKH
jgi:hypothetical protein